MTYCYQNFSILDISKWLLGTETIKLPAVQRGFVWSPSQIENLWDSLLRGYPIGTFMMTNTNDLLDGQQRATSIALGFYNPWKTNIVKIGNAKDLPVIWIDVLPSKLSPSNQYGIRVVTRAQPWGYQLADNTKVLSSGDKIKACKNLSNTEISNNFQYTKISPCDRVPYDSTLPIPLCWLLEEAQQDEPKAHHLLTICQELLTHSIQTKGLTDTTYLEKLTQLCQDGTLDTLLQQIKEVLKCQFVSTIVNIETIDQESSTPNSDDITLFVRVNTAGTKIAGDELLYSYFKGICPEIKEAMDKQDVTFISPVKLVNLMVRLTKSLHSNQHEYVESVNLTKFRRYIENIDYKETLLHHLEDSTKALVDQACDILQYANMPKVVVRQFIQKGSNGFLMLLYWLSYHKDSVSTDIKREICKNLYGHYFFGDIDEYVKANWKYASQLDFWHLDIETKDKSHNIPFVAPHVLEQYLKERISSGGEIGLLETDEDIRALLQKLVPQGNLSDEYYSTLSKECWNSFVTKLLSCKSLILFAQRKYINDTFKDFNQLESLQDTNTPWDWDHIYPSSWVYNRDHIAPSVKFWEWRIGNFRAMSLIDNRSENNNLSPAERLRDVENDFFINSNDGNYWAQLDMNHKITTSSLHHSDWINHAMAIMLRSVNIYQEYYTQFVDPSYSQRKM